MISRDMNRVTRSSAQKNCAQKKDLPKRSTRKQQPATILEYSSDSEEERESIVSKSSKLQITPTKQKANRFQTEVNHPSYVTPPKQRKRGNCVDNNVLSTPSNLLKKLTLTSPIKKNTESSSRKSLFVVHNDVEQENKLQSISKSKTNINKSTATKLKEDGAREVPVGNVNKPKSQYQDVRKVLHHNYPTDMPGREEEIEKLTNFIEDHLASNTSASIYVSGPPGTGKTASLNLILQDQDIASRVKYIYINCTAIKSATAVYSRFAKELQLKVDGKCEKDNLSSIEKYLKKKHKMILVVLDEIDQLETKNLSILYTIFEWPSTPNSKLILVGIANALDLTDRILPRLQARSELKPKLLHFTPYSKEQIVTIFTSRLKSAGVLDVFSPIALQMLAGKVSAVSGDVRRALDIGRRLVELIDKNKKDDILKSIENFTNELENESKSTESVEVNIQKVISVLNNVYGTSQNLNDNIEESFPLQQKIVICTLLLMIKNAKNKDITIGKLHEVYFKVCMKRNVTPVGPAEFVGLCSLIEIRGIVKISGKKEPRMHKVNLEWNEKEVAEALGDKQLISTILEDNTCLGKL